jgi:hypothetical protein
MDGSLVAACLGWALLGHQPGAGSALVQVVRRRAVRWRAARRSGCGPQQQSSSSQQAAAACSGAQAGSSMQGRAPAPARSHPPNRQAASAETKP